MVFYLKYRITFFFHIENLALNGTPSQSTDYNWKDRKINLTAELAVSGIYTDTFGGEACSVTLATPGQSVAWWMLTFPVDTVYITNVSINYRNDCKCSFLLIHFN